MGRKNSEQWRQDLEDAFAALQLATTYADDGAFLTAAKKAEDAAAKFRAGHAGRQAAIEAAVS